MQKNKTDHQGRNQVTIDELKVLGEQHCIFYEKHYLGEYDTRKDTGENGEAPEATPPT